MIALVLVLMMPPGTLVVPIPDAPLQLNAAEAWQDESLRSAFGLWDSGGRLRFEYARVAFGTPNTSTFEVAFSGLRASTSLGDKLELFGQAGLTQTVAKSGGLVSVSWGGRLMLGVAGKFDSLVVERLVTGRRLTR
jgi:hypothetical protein